MAAGDEDVRTLLDAVAEQAGELRVTRPGVERAVRRRRMSRALAAAAAAAAVIGVAVPLSLTGRSGGTGPAANQTGGPACGAAIPQPTSMARNWSTRRSTARSSWCAASRARWST